MLTGKTVILGVTGSIAAYKIANLASMLKKAHADVHVIMTKNATNFINPITFETLTGNKCLTDTFDRNFEFNVEHVSLAKKADLIMIAPASANVIGKAACGIADDMLTTTLLACRCPRLIAPAMNTRMFENEIVQDNMRRLADFGFEFIMPDDGYLACGDTGKGKMVAETVLFEHIERHLACEKDLVGKRVLITSGATRESVDPVRFITNHSSGKMGIALAKNAMLRGAEVTLVCGAVTADKPPFVKCVDVVSANEMFEEVTRLAPDMDIIIKAAEVADYRPKTVYTEKVKKKDGDMSIELERTHDIIKYLGEHRSGKQFICGFSMETENMLENSRKKLVAKNIDMIAANNLKVEGAGFGTDTNIVTLITPTETIPLEKMTKHQVAAAIFDKILDMTK